MLFHARMGGPRVYLDYNATAPVRHEVRRAVEPLLFGTTEDGYFGNPSSIHWAGQTARKHLEQARAAIARIFDRRPSEVIFTSGGTEADNLALQAKTRLLVSAVEHPAVMSAAERLEQRGVIVERIGVSSEGVLDLQQLDRLLEQKADLVSVMVVNNETGVISPIEEVIARAHRRGALVHVDAVQAIGRVELARFLDADLITISGHKLGALKGIGALIARTHVPLVSAIVGGPQERGHRAGTEHAAAAVSLARALELAIEEREPESRRLAELRDRIDRAVEQIPGARILGKNAPRIFSTTTAVFGGVDGESVLQALDLESIAASSGSACSSGSLEPSHVLLAMGVPGDLALSSVRFSLGFGTTGADIARVEEVLPPLVARLRAVTE